MSKRPIHGILWDFDGTLVDTRVRNYQINRRIVSQLTSRDPDEVPALRSLAAYEEANHRTANWRELYEVMLDLPSHLVETAGKLWNDLQAKDSTPAPCFDGIREVLGSLTHLPHGIVSLNGLANIERLLQVEGIHPHFEMVVGYEQVERQKPAPDGILACIDRLASKGPGRFLYVGDHETDSRAAAGANQVLQEQRSEVEVTMIGVQYGKGEAAEPWRTQPDYEVHSATEILDIVARLV